MGWLIVDGHQDIAMSLLEDPTRDFAAPAPAGRALSLADARRGGLAVILATIFAAASESRHRTGSSSRLAVSA